MIIAVENARFRRSRSFRAKTAQAPATLRAEPRRRQGPGTFIENNCSNPAGVPVRAKEGVMNGIIYLVGLIVIIMAILSFLGLR